MTVGEKIAQLRKGRGWTQDLLGERLGMNPRHVSRWENNHTRPSVKTLKRIAKLFDLEIDEFLDQQRALPDVSERQDDLSRVVRQIQDFTAEDRAIVLRMIELIATQKRMADLVGHRHR
ncbi:MAG: helix-turn-helix domain-containing protein [Candidatus Xenobia bacterium]